MRTQKFLIKILIFLELLISFVLGIFFFAKTYGYFFPFPKRLPIYASDNYIYLTARVNPKVDKNKILSLISFNYSSFTKKYPQWQGGNFKKFMDKHSLFLTSYSIEDVCRLILEKDIPYWEKGGVEISLQIGRKWIPLNNFVKVYTDDYALGEIVFLPLGMEGLTIKDITPEEFITNYFGKMRIYIRDSRIMRLQTINIRIGDGS